MTPLVFILLPILAMLYATARWRKLEDGFCKRCITHEEETPKPLPVQPSVPRRESQMVWSREEAEGRSHGQPGPQTLA